VRTRSNTATGLVAIAVLACSNPPADEPQPEPVSAETRDLALTPPDAGEAIASELEAPRPVPEENGSLRPAVRRPTPPAPIGNPAAFVSDEVAEAVEPGPVMAGHPRIDDRMESPASGPYAGAGEGGKPRVPMTGERVPDPGPGPGLGVIIRGGPGRDGDDCVTHRPPPPNAGDVRPPEGTGVLINERTPRRGPAQVGDRMPTSGPSRVIDRTSGRGPHTGRGIR
jgi:hypothetical protein